MPSSASRRDFFAFLDAQVGKQTLTRYITNGQTDVKAALNEKFLKDKQDFLSKTSICQNGYYRVSRRHQCLVNWFVRFCVALESLE